MRILSALLLILALGCIGEPKPPPATLSGRVRAKSDPLSAAELARSVVYLETIDPAPGESPPAAAELHHRSARFAPELAAVAPDDPVWFINDDTIFHGAFSYSRPNQFDLGVYGPGQRRVLRFAHAGAVRFHCPIHSDEAGVVLVLPTRLVVRPAASGAYQITGVSAGRYWLKAWADGLPEVAYDVTLRPGEVAFRDIVLRPARTTAGGN